MRISDWRSDVCSSDLPPILLLRSGGRSWSRTGVERGRADAHISDGPVSGAQWRAFLAADGHAPRLRTASQDLWILCVRWNRVGFARRPLLFDHSFFISVIYPHQDCIGGCLIGSLSIRDTSG